MAVEILKDRYGSKVGTLTIGNGPAEGGTRTSVITVGGEGTLPAYHFEGELPHRPVIAMEITDVAPDWNPTLLEALGDVGSTTAWAKRCVEEFGADMLYLSLIGANPEGANRPVSSCVATVKEVLAEVGVPLAIVGCGDEEKDNELMQAVAEATAGENLLLGVAEQENYKTLTAACIVHGHSIIAKSPIDINMCKQLNIMITEMNLPPERICIDPTTAALGYGLEYSYSIIERARLGALQGDKMLAMPMIATVGHEAWRSKEANVSPAEFPGWGLQETRGVLWEAVTAAALLQAGAHILVVRHPQSAELLRNHIDQLMVANAY
ncbi:MAG: acetyl-CoA decarbonylase/synthase complex subunit delta [Limnochordia bacterium]|nr:acetyl-CoA decarbonylase/synthase complex subunit delta [Bacillota bacterium]